MRYNWIVDLDPSNIFNFKAPLTFTTTSQIDLTIYKSRISEEVGCGKCIPSPAGTFIDVRHYTKGVYYLKVGNEVRKIVIE